MELTSKKIDEIKRDNQENSKKIMDETSKKIDEIKRDNQENRRNKAR